MIRFNVRLKFMFGRSARYNFEMKGNYFMYDFLSKLFEDKRGGYLFECFDIWHISLLIVMLSAIAVAFLLVRDKSDQVKKKLLDCTIGIAFGLYIADFFLMPFAYGFIEIEKLPFHACTLTCLLCFLSRHNEFLGKFKKTFAIFGFVSNLCFVVYPAGVVWAQVHPLSYRAIQTLVFHSVMVAYGFLALVFDKDIVFDWKKILKQDLVILALMIGWALIGSYSYTGYYDGYEHWYNWFFVRTDPFGILPPAVAPFVTLLAFLLADVVIHLTYFLVKKYWKKAK